MKGGARPISIRLDAALMRRATVFARRRKVGVSTALRMIISEHLEAADAGAELDAALRWQRERAWAAFERWEREEVGEVSLDELRRAHGQAMRRARRR
ncbi:MAG TPA: hypothetical protein VFE90_12865 [Myxococcales bacterium]|jgi:hypothetical protein|nr:hypothetical protein [Myxococcales bacterium]